ncbi:hypothetical protein F4604DRAFT_1682017 [Suillus subluteus]|nr:hypothetical protein F4604DRAFT_1682017 [Suillus subluteus]
MSVGVINMLGLTTVMRETVVDMQNAYGDSTQEGSRREWCISCPSDDWIRLGASICEVGQVPSSGSTTTVMGNYLKSQKEISGHWLLIMDTALILGVLESAPLDAFATFRKFETKLVYDVKAGPPLTTRRWMKSGPNSSSSEISPWREGRSLNIVRSAISPLPLAIAQRSSLVVESFWRLIVDGVAFGGLEKIRKWIAIFGMISASWTCVL